MYNADSSCKTASQILPDFQNLVVGSYPLVRNYGVDCNQVANVMAAAKSIGVRVMLGVYEL